jgi:hypothetical protein
MRRSLRQRRRDVVRQTPLFKDDGPISAGLMRPGWFTRISDRAVSFFARFESDEPEPVEVTTDPTASRTAVHIWAGFGFSALLLSVAGRIDQAPLYFGAQATMMIGLKAWFGWHRRNPPIRNAGSTKRGVLSALAHAAGAFGAGLFFLYVLRRSFPDMMLGSDWLHVLELLILPPGLAVMTYQRRTAWDHDDPERMVIIGAVTAVFVAVLFVLRLVR